MYNIYIHIEGCCCCDDILDTTLCDQVCLSLATGQWFSPCTLVTSTNKTDRHDINEISVESGIKHHNRNPTFILT